MTCVTGARRNLLPLGVGILTFFFLKRQSRWARVPNGSACGACRLSF
jgi:hypothetical protein